MAPGAREPDRLDPGRPDARLARGHHGARRDGSVGASRGGARRWKPQDRLLLARHAVTAALAPDPAARLVAVYVIVHFQPLLGRERGFSFLLSRRREDSMRGFRTYCGSGRGGGLEGSYFSQHFFMRHRQQSGEDRMALGGTGATKHSIPAGLEFGSRYAPVLFFLGRGGNGRWRLRLLVFLFSNPTPQDKPKPKTTEESISEVPLGLSIAWGGTPTSWCPHRPPTREK